MVRLIPRTRTRRFLLAILVLIVLGWFIAPRLLAPIVTSKLQKMVAAQLNARLEIGGLSYRPPYGVRATNVKLIAPDGADPDLQLLTIKELDLTLAKLPFGSGPLVIREIKVVEPSLHLVQTADGLAGRVKPAAADGAPAAKTPSTARRSDMFLLRHLSLQGGQIVLEDRERPGLPPMVWNDFSIDMNAAQKSHSEYEFKIGAAHSDLASMRANGSFDIDDLWVKLDDFQTAAQPGTQSQSAMPAQVQNVLEQYGIAGQVKLQMRGRLELLRLRESVFNGSIELAKGRVAFPGKSQSIDDVDARLTFNRPAAKAGESSRLAVTIERFNLKSLDQHLTVSSANFSIDDSTGHWSLDHLDAALSDGAIDATRPSHRQNLDGPGSVGGSAHVSLSAEGFLPRPRKGRVRSEARPLIDSDSLAFEVQPNGLNVWPKKYPLPLEEVRGGAIRKRAGTRVITFENLQGRYGADPVSLKSARMPLPADVASLKSHWRIEEIVGAIEFRPPGTEYPRGMEQVMRQLRPAGLFAVGGGSWFEVNEVPIVSGEAPTTRPLSTSDPREPIENLVDDAADTIAFAATAGVQPVFRIRHKADYFISASADSLTFNLLNGQLPATGIRGDATFSPLSVRIEHIDGNLLGGRVSGQLQVIPKNPFPFNGKISARDLQLQQLESLSSLTAAQRQKLSGTAALDSTFEARWGTDRTERLNSIRAAGEFEVFNGRFWSLPVLRDLLGAAGNGKGDPTSVGEAAGRFEIADGTMQLPHVAVCAPALGLIGSGNITIADKALALQVVAAPLGDWRDRMKQAKLPIVSDVAGEVVGAVQQVLNSATGAVLYQFEVTGTTGNPQVHAVPAPALTEGAAGLFSQMLNPDQHERKWSAAARREK